jgi:iron complex outermembrane recepter protein
MRKIGIGLYCLVIMMLIPFVSFAGQPDMAKDDETPQAMKEVVVTATRYAEEIAKVPANVSVFSEKDINNSTARDVADFLRMAPGVHVNDVTGGQRFYSVDLRGFGETAKLNTLVLVDGRRTNQADLSGTEWAQIPLDRVERIEIVRGGRASVLYGDNAAGGVVNIITKKGEHFEAGAEVSGGSYDTYKVSAHLSGSQKGLSYAINGSYMDTDGYRDNSQNQIKDIGLNLGYLVGEKLAFNLSHGYHKDTAGLPGAIKDSDFAAGVGRTDSVNPNDFADTEDYYVKGGAELYFFSDSLLKIDLSYRERTFESFATFSGGFFTGDTEIQTVTFSPQVVFMEKVFGLKNTLSIGFDYADVEEDITNTSEFFGFLSQTMTNMERENYGYFFHEELFLTPQLSISAGYRYDNAEYEFDAFPVLPVLDSTEIDEELFTAGINYKLNNKSNVYFSYSRSYRYPVLDEIFNFFNNSIDPSLGPQTSDDYELGMRYALMPNMTVGLNFFYIETDDEIFYNPDFFSNMNMDGETCRKGIELTVAKDLKWGSVDASYTYTDAEIDDGTFDGNDIPDVPEHLAGINVLVDFWKPFTLVVNGQYVGERTFISDWQNNFTDHEDHFIVNTKLKYRWKNATAFIDINNLFNEDYSEYGVLGGFPLEKAVYPSPRTNFLVGVTVEL